MGHVDQPLVSVSSDPPNAATPFSALRRAVVPNESFYVRCNFPVPTVEASSWTLPVEGSVAVPARYDLADLGAFPFVRSVVTMECAGNGRVLMDPVPAGTPWGLGAVSAAEFGGARLRDLVAAAQPAPDTAELVFTGADRGVVDPEGEIPYAFSLPLAEVDSTDPILAWEMNGDPLPEEHGFPLRLVVPGGYGMQSVKWLSGITALQRPFLGHFVRKYRFFGDADEPEGTPVSRMKVRSLVLDPAEGAMLPLSDMTISGIAWSGVAPIAGVEVDVGDGWMGATVEPSSQHPHAPVPWSVPWTPEQPGPVAIRARATDASGDRQPLQSRWNANGYANNVVHRVDVVVTEPSTPE